MIGSRKQGFYRIEMDNLAYLVQSGLLPDTTGYELTSLTGGFWNDVYRLRRNGRDWVIKHFLAANPDGLYPILPEAEALALETLAGLEIAPEPIAFLPERSLLVYEFFPGEVWQQDGTVIGRLLHRLHEVAVRPKSGFRHLPVTSVAVLEQGDRILGQAVPDGLTEQLRGLRPVPVSLPPLERLSLVHTDTWAGNFMQNGDDVRLIDWQCPGLGDPAEDVWTFLRSGYEMLLGRPRFEAQVEAEFWRGYGETAVGERLLLLGPFFAYRIAAHCCLRHQQLAETNPTASANYRKVFSWLIGTLV